MNINISQIPYSYINENKIVQNQLRTASVLPDTFENTHKNDNNVSFGGGFFKNLANRIFSLQETTSREDETASPFAKELSEGMRDVMALSSNMKCDIKPSCLKSIMSPDEIRELLPTLTQENFICDPVNVDTGVYCVDLDYQTNFSSGNENVFQVLDDVAAYADRYYEEHGKEFVFALTDRDSIEGIQHAIRIIGSDPEKYKHVKFIPGLKLSFAHIAPKSGLEFENSEMLIYGINPFSENIINFVENTIQKRKSMVIDFIKQVNDLYPEFSYKVIEFVKQNNIKYKKDFGVPNLYWRAREYAQMKGDTEIKGMKIVPEQIIKESQAILNDLDRVYTGSQAKKRETTGSFLDMEDEEINKNIRSIFNEYSTHVDENKGRVVSSAENLYLDMIECLSRENQQPVLALASPFYFSHYFEDQQTTTYDNVVQFFYDLIEESNGMLIAFESVAPFYDLDTGLTQRKVDKFNEYIRKKTNLFEVGGSFAKA